MGRRVVSDKTQLPKYDDLLRTTLDALERLGSSASIDELEEAMVAAIGATQEQLYLLYPKSGAPILLDRMSWARSALKISGFVENPKRGVWVLTERGRSVSDKQNPELKAIISREYRASQAERKASGIKAGSSSLEDVAEGEIGWSDRLLNRIQTIEPSAFERLCQRILRQSGFTRVEVRRKSGDGGIDGVGVLRVNLISFQVIFQCKRYKGTVGSETVRNFRGAMQGRADKGLIITTGTFTADARKEATRDGAPAIDLIDGESLCLLMRDLLLGIRVREVKTEEITVDEEFFATV